MSAPIKSIALARVDGWISRQPIYTAPQGRTIIGMRSAAGDNAVTVTLDNGEIVRVECAAPPGATVH